MPLHIPLHIYTTYSHPYDIHIYFPPYLHPYDMYIHRIYTFTSPHIYIHMTFDSIFHDIFTQHIHIHMIYIFTSLFTSI